MTSIHRGLLIKIIKTSQIRKIEGLEGVQNESAESRHPGIREVGGSRAHHELDFKLLLQLVLDFWDKIYLLLFLEH